MFNFFPQIIILLSLAGIIVIIARKFPALAEVEKKRLEQEPSLNKNIFREKIKILGLGIKKFSLVVFRHLFIQIAKIRSFFRETRKTPSLIQKQLKNLIIKKPSPGEEVPKPDTSVSPQVLLSKASDLIKEDKLDEAEKIYIEVLKKDPKNIKAYESLGKIYLKRHNFGDAKAAFRQVRKLDPNNRNALIQLKKLGEATEEAVEKIEEK